MVGTGLFNGPAVGAGGRCGITTTGDNCNVESLASLLPPPILQKLSDI